MKDILNRKIENSDYITSNYGGGVLTKSTVTPYAETSMVDYRDYTGNWVVYAFNTLGIARGGMTITSSISTLPYNIIVPEDGIYLAEFNGVAKSDNMTTGLYLAGIKSSKNFNNFAISPFVVSQGLLTTEVSSTFLLNKGDSLGVYFYLGSHTITMNPSNVGYYTKFSVTKIGT